jgi:hypothetical protein
MSTSNDGTVTASIFVTMATPQEKQADAESPTKQTKFH